MLKPKIGLQCVRFVIALLLALQQNFETTDMINNVYQSPPLPSPINITSVKAASDYLVNLVNALSGVLRDDAAAINALIDVETSPQAPMILPTYVKTALPSASVYINGMIIVSNDTGGLTPAFSDGTNWRRTADRNIIS